MKKLNIKKVLNISLVLLITMSVILSNNVYAEFGSGLDTGIYNDVTSMGDNAGKLEEPVARVFGTVMIILQICAIAGVVITGVKYMYAAAEDRAKIKQTLIIDFITKSASQVIR